MLQRFVDNVLAITKESVKTFTYEVLSSTVRLINGVSGLILILLPGKSTILEGVQGWELRPAFRGPRLPRWMDNGVSSFNQFIHELAVDSDTSNVDYLSGEDCDKSIYLASPSSHGSEIYRARSFPKYGKDKKRWVKCLLSWIFWPAKSISFHIYSSYGFKGSRNPSTPRIHQHSHSHSIKKSNFFNEFVFNRTTDRRRGVIEDLHLAMEIFIEAIFDVVHKAAQCLLSPSETFRMLFIWVSLWTGIKEVPVSGSDISVPTATLGENEPTPTERKTKFHQLMNTDGRTCQDVITEMGYPYEAIRVVTGDGYVLLLERIPRRDARKAVYLQHGVMDSSMGWVSNGVVGSPAFAAFDQGYDVFLGNFRGLVSREHIIQNISSQQYWNYSINEHGTQDIPAMIEKIHQVKASELRSIQSDLEDEINDDQPYRLCTICHSMGGAAMLMYVITRRIEGKPHRLSRLILLSPGGFHDDSSLAFTVAEYLFLTFAPILAPFVPALYIPTRFFRMLLNKLARDFHNYPALGGLIQTLMSYVVGGDSSNWVGVLGLPHINMYDMPGMSIFVALHFAQIKHRRRFIMYDYRSAAANMQVYGSPEPLDIGEHYWLIDVPVDLVAGLKDNVIRPSMVRRHYRLMKNSGVDVSFNEFEYAHLDFTFSHREELLNYVMSCLLLC